MAKQERTRKSAPQNRVESFVSATEDILPCSQLDSDEMDRFKAIIHSRERSTWTEADRGIATKLAELEIQWHREREMVKIEGTVIDGSYNPRNRVCESLFGQINRMRRDLGLSASQRSISGHKQKKRNQQDSDTGKGSSFGSLISMPDAKA